MTDTWGRRDIAGRWPRPSAIWTISIALVAAAMTAVAVSVQVAALTPIQRAYLPAYLRSTLMGAAGISGTGRYGVLYASVPRGARLALDPAAGSISSLAWRDGRYSHRDFHRFLRRWIYHDRGLSDLFRTSLWCGLAVFAAGLLIAIPTDLKRARDRRHGVRLKGPELVSPWRFSRRTGGDGIAFEQRPGRLRRSPPVRIPRAMESSHLLVVGDSGTGKSALIRQILRQLEARGDAAVVYDPALEYTGQFYTSDRGDIILNPLDVRAPYWTPADEWRDEAETLTLATSLFPDRHQENAFFVEAPRRIFAYLLTLKPSPDELVSWLRHDEEIDRRLAGTAYAAMIDHQAPAQRSGVLASLNMVADTLDLLPLARETERRWSANAWANEHPHGWLFLTSTPETRQRLVPLTSLWLDTLVLRLMNQGRPRTYPTWFVLDELASLQRLPQLHAAVTENRKSNNPVVLGFQGRSQIEARYGHDAEAILSQPATKIFLRTTEPRAAKWIADAIGEVEIERLRESRSQGFRSQQSYGLERQVEPLVLPSEISGLPSMHGFLKLANLVVRMQFPYTALPIRAQPFIERHREPRTLERRDAQPYSSAPKPAPSSEDRRSDRKRQPGHHFSFPQLPFER